MKTLDIKKLILKYSIITSVVCLIIADLYVTYSNKIINYLLVPFLSIDINNDGEPDLKQLKAYRLKLFRGINIPIGLLVYHIIILLLKILLLFVIIQQILKYVTDFD